MPWRDGRVGPLPGNKAVTMVAEIFEEEQRINSMWREYDAARGKDPALKRRIDEEQLALLKAFRDEISSVIGVDMPDLP